eukprot:CAMPEP_0175179048 /NCGR_PEP_ID=MMETSP0087-20121206/35292_1 /TAXON_ID=136419 /ORGANISM="Unknown Unknown, Strain D1" /LENGTH=38 /DNA_ID= /DNA_START= /DNA_END= /DNA_ORIENTATION=
MTIRRSKRNIVDVFLFGGFGLLEFQVLLQQRQMVLAKI